MEPVSPGEPVFPHMTAQWFNSTLPSPGKGSGKRHNMQERQHGGIHSAYVVDGEVDQYNPIGLTDITQHPGGGFPVLKLSLADINRHNWVIPQVNTVAERTIPVALWGYTFAVVDTTNEGNCVIYNEDTEQLETAKYGKAYIVFEGDPCLICFGNSNEVTHLTGTLTAELSGSTGNITNLKGLNGEIDHLSDPLSVYNPHTFLGDSGALARVEWNHTEQRWDIYQLTCPTS